MLLGVSQIKMSTKIDITAFCNNSKPALNDSADVRYLQVKWYSLFSLAELARFVCTRFAVNGEIST